jgi:predicted lipoprotein
VRAGAVLLLAAACAEVQSGPNNGAVFLTAVADDLVLPTLSEQVERADQLVRAAQEACTGSSAVGLAVVEAAWRSSRAPLKRGEAFSFGPTDTLRLEANLDFWPARPEDVEATLSDSSTISEAAISALGATRRGSPAIEVLLFDPLGDQEATWTRLQARGGRGCRYLVAAAQVYAADLRTLRGAWSPNGGDFRAQLADPGQGASPYFSDSRAAVSGVVNQMIGTLGTLESLKLAKPLGRQSGGVPVLAALESRPSGNSTADAANSLAGVRALYLTKPNNGPSLQEFVAERAPEADAELLSTWDDLALALGNFDRSLERMILERPDDVTAAFVLAQSAHRQLAGPIAGVLGVTVSFSDADGD